MTRLESFMITIKTGERGRSGVPSFVFNGVSCEFEDTDGGCGPHETFEAGFALHSDVHEFVLRGPDEGEWDIEETEVTCLVPGQEPYSVRFGAVALDAEADMNLWREKPVEAFDV